MENKRLLIAALLSMAVGFAWQFFFAPQPPAPDPAATAASTPASPAGEAPALADSPTGTPETAVAPPPAENPVSGEAAGETGAAEAEEVAAAPPAEPIAAAEEERLVLESERVRAEFSNRGAQLLSWQLKAQHRNGGAELIDLVHPRTEGPWPFALLAADGEPLAANDSLFVAESQGESALSFRYRGAEGEVEKRFELGEDGLLRVAIEARVGEPWAVLFGPAVRELTAAELKDRFTASKATWLAGGEMDSVATRKANEPTVLSGAGLSWLALEDNHFLVAALPDSLLDRALVVPYLQTPEGGAEAGRFLPLPPPGQITGGQAELPRSYALWLFPRGETMETRAYLGVKQLDVLQALPGGLDRTVLPGVTGLLARPLLWGLNWLYEHGVPNYGWAIILMTIAIKLLLFPLTHKSYVSMQKMQALAPEVQALRNRYRGKMRDKQGRPNVEAQRQMNDEMMALYRERGVNPAGGCLPMLLQLPILFAFYRLLYSAVELRGAPWIGWIQDLSIYDPFYVLPIVMGATQFIQTKMTPMMGSPMQQRIFLLMPVFFTVLFLRFPAGLVLYWLVNNVLTIGQQWLIRRIAPAKTAAAGPQKAN